MAVLSDYTSGTITVAQNSVNFTGTDTLWRTMRFREGDTVQLQGYTMVIKGIDEPGQPIESNTSGQFTEPWPGAGGTFEYRMRFLPDNARVSGQSAELIELLGNGILDNIASVPVEDGNLLIGNASGQYEPISKGALGIQDPNGSLGKLAALTLAANKAITTDGSGNVQQSDLGTLGRALLALAAGNNTQYVQGDGTLQAKAGLPVSTATQTALNGKANLNGAAFSGAISAQTEITSRNLRGSGAGGVATAGLITSGFNDAPYYARFVCQEVIGTTVRAALHVYLSESNQGFFLFGVDGSLNVPGTLSKGGGTFLIDHPLDPLNKNLRHGFVEAPRYDLIYRGTVQLENGRAMVDIDAASNMSSGTFTALTTNAVVTSLQNQEGFARLKPGPINGGAFEIVCEDENCTDLVSWVVIAERNDPFVKSDLDQNTDGDGRFVPEFEKEDA
ncbi:hypothetical protein DK867_02805 [Ochrobactrum sp. POC9]|uniref:hypothetical protein n=1 Tax=Ochrobactrum sp. POC9 TaxID=2203419 RepID=UPI000D705C5F|nr:hypothetical protein [Ochrobactrum sp. POC9]PWU76219.1 hypothetical protein DK867_02805 [Ochrobactrum sp. POC9]